MSQLAPLASGRLPVTVQLPANPMPNLRSLYHCRNDKSIFLDVFTLRTVAGGVFRTEGRKGRKEGSGEWAVRALASRS
jgi:hypothetical protein